MYLQLSSIITNPKMYGCANFNMFLIELYTIKGKLDLNLFLKEAGYLDEKLLPTEACLKNDMFRIVETSINASGQKTAYSKKIFITKKGILSIISRIYTYRIKNDSFLN